LPVGAEFLLRAQPNLLNRIKLMLPVQSSLQKYSDSILTQITSITLAVSSHIRGVSRSSRTRGGMRWTRAALLTSALTCGRRSRVVLTSRRWRQVGERDFTGDGGKQARSPGRARSKPLKPLRREGRVFRWTCGDALACFPHFARGAAGAAGTRFSLRPLIFRANGSSIARAFRAAGSQKCISPSLRAKRSNPSSREARMDCFVAEPVIGRAFARPVGSSQ